MASKPPKTYDAFIQRFPELGRAWEMLGQGAQGAGPLDEKTCRLVKLAIAIGAMREGAVHSAVRKARDSGARVEEVEQVVALAASTIGLPTAVAAWTWVRDAQARPGRAGKAKARKKK